MIGSFTKSVEVNEYLVKANSLGIRLHTILLVPILYGA